MDDSLTELLAAANRGDGAAAQRVFEHLYEELRRCAHRQLRANAGHTLCTTALVHESWLKLAAAERVLPETRGHFMALAARAMRQVLVDAARRAGAGKRGGDAIFLTLDDQIHDGASEALEILALDRALLALEQIDARASRVVQLHFFAGMTFAAIGELEGLNERTIKRDWEAARLLLAADIGNGD
jgi:RNA polymerase sigma factor (TIGR02999 family)